MGMCKSACYYCDITWICFRFCLRLNNYLQICPRDLSWGWIVECWGTWDGMGRYLKQWAPLMIWNIIPEWLQNFEKKNSKDNWNRCAGNSRDAQITAMCWGLASVYWTLFNAVQHPKGKETAGSGDNTAGPAIAPTPCKRPCGALSQPSSTLLPVLSFIPCRGGEWANNCLVFSCLPP